MCEKSWRLPLGLLFCLVLVLASVSSLRAQSLTVPDPTPSPTKPSSVTISTDSLLTLWQKLLDSRASLSEAQKQAEIAQQQAEQAQQQAQTAQTKAESLSAQLDQQQQDSTELSKSLAQSLTKAALVDQATKAREILDQKAIDEAKAQNWLYAGSSALATLALIKGWDFVVSLMGK